MIQRVTLASFAALALAGTLGGVYLGRAAVAEINPIYYDEPETRFHADLVPYRPTEAAGYQAGDLSAAELDQALGRGCVNCLTYPEEVVLVHRGGSAAKYAVGYGEVSAEPVQAAAYQPTPPPEFAAVERYTSYPVAPEADPTEPAGEVELAAADTVSDASD
jgi:hypothetical protein